MVRMGFLLRPILLSLLRTRIVCLVRFRAVTGDRSPARTIAMEAAI
jgi:hypothetical protein